MIRAGLLAALALGALAAVPARAQESDPATETEHVVKPGETLGGIAQRAVVPRILIIEANGLKPPYNVRIGQRLIIPRRRVHTVKQGESGFAIAMQYGVPWSGIAEANGIDAKAALRRGQELVIPTLSTPQEVSATASPAQPASPQSAQRGFAWPVTGKITRSFAERDSGRRHDGIDIAAAKGTAVRATAAGRVLFAGDEPRQFGKLVVIDHGKGWTSSYGFLDKVTVKEGDRVKAGERVGLAGRTGLAKRDELHFELRKDNQPTDPTDELPKAE